MVTCYLLYFDWSNFGNTQYHTHTESYTKSKSKIIGVVLYKKDKVFKRIRNINLLSTSKQFTKGNSFNVQSVTIRLLEKTPLSLIRDLYIKAKSFNISNVLLSSLEKLA